MTLTEPLRLLLIAVPLGFAITYVALQFARNKYSVRFATTDLLASVAPKRPGWRRHITATCILLSMVLFIVAFARPVTQRKVARERSTVILAIDVSISMLATDVDPTRIAAVKAAASSFLRTAPSNVQVGIVSFAGTATSSVSPTFDRAKLERAVTNLELGQGTAIGEAIFASLDTLVISEVVQRDKPSNPKNAPARIVLMSDGATNQGRSNDDAVEAAQKLGIPVSTIAFGTDEGTVPNPQTGQPIRVPVDGDALATIADETGGDYFEAATSDAIKQVYQNIGQQVGVELVNQDIGAWFVGFGLILAFLGLGLSLIWTNRLL